jgi:hypothetical protein
LRSEWSWGGCLVGIGIGIGAEALCFDSLSLLLPRCQAPLSAMFNLNWF